MKDLMINSLYYYPTKIINTHIFLNYLIPCKKKDYLFIYYLYYFLFEWQDWDESFGRNIFAVYLENNVLQHLKINQLFCPNIGTFAHSYVANSAPLHLNGILWYYSTKI